MRGIVQVVQPLRQVEGAGAVPQERHQRGIVGVHRRQFRQGNPLGELVAAAVVLQIGLLQLAELQAEDMRLYPDPAAGLLVARITFLNPEALQLEDKMTAFFGLFNSPRILSFS